MSVYYRTIGQILVVFEVEREGSWEGAREALRLVLPCPGRLTLLGLTLDKRDLFQTAHIYAQAHNVRYVQTHRPGEHGLLET